MIDATKAGIVSDAVDLVKAWTRERRPVKPLRPGEMPDHAIASSSTRANSSPAFSGVESPDSSKPATASAGPVWPESAHATFAIWAWSMSAWATRA